MWFSEYGSFKIYHMYPNPPSHRTGNSQEMPHGREIKTVQITLKHNIKKKTVYFSFFGLRLTLFRSNYLSDKYKIIYLAQMIIC